MTKKISTILVFTLLAALSAFGQMNTLSSTTLSAAIDNKQLTFTLASTSGIGNYPNLQQSQGGIGSPSGATLTELFIDQEAMEAYVVPVSGTVTVKMRGDHGSIQRAHVSGAKVWIGTPAYFTSTDPSGACTASLLTVLPLVNEKNGRIWNCGNGQWTTFDGYKSIVGAAIASATTIAPTNPVFHVSGTTSVATITVPPACPWTGCAITIVPDGIFATTTAGNIALISTSVVSKALIMTYDPGTSKWYPSY